jgi:hypothetical protein
MENEMKYFYEGKIKISGTIEADDEWDLQKKVEGIVWLHLIGEDDALDVEETDINSIGEVSDDEVSI